MKKLLLLLLLSSNLMFAEKYAIIIAVGEYPAKTGWSPISSGNDVPLIKNTLLNQGFSEKNIRVLLNEAATRDGIMTSLKELSEKVIRGDIVVLHYSGHGQQIFDQNSEEIDGLDESIVPYDAWVKYTHNYKGERHIRDDEIGDILVEFRNNLGKNGQLLMLLDSCHSGSATRGGKPRGSASAFVPENWEESKVKAENSGSAMFEKAKVDEDAAPFILISGASANELNYEYEGKGSLSYSFAKAMNELGSGFTYRQLYSKIASVMNTISPNQTPTIEGDQDYLLFKGEYVKQQPYFEASKVLRNDVLKMQAGKLHGIFENTTVNVLPAGTTKVTPEKIMSTGTVVMSKYNESNIQLDKPLPDQNEKNYWIFIKDKSYGDISLKVFLDKKIKATLLTKEISTFLSEKNLGEVVEDTLLSDVIVSQEGENFLLYATNDLAEVGSATKSRGSAAVEELQQKLYNFAQGQYLKNLNLDNTAYEFSFRILPMEYDVATEAFDDTLPASSYLNGNGMFAVRPGQDHVVLEVTNHSEIPIYFSIIEINTQGEISPFLPNGNCELNDNERRLEPGMTMIFRDCVFSFAPPYEKLVLKGFASPTPLNFQPTVRTRGKIGSTNPLESFLSETYSQTRGGGGNKVSGKVDGYSTEFIYEIVKKR